MWKTRLEKFAWIFAGYLVFVILFGAWVRISGSGAGCGNHWPSCQGVVIPVEPSTKTIIEFTHRVTSALSGLWGILLLVWAWRTKSVARWWALGTFIFLLVEGFVGAVLVKKELVADDASVNRAVVISLHLVNTMLLMLCSVATAVRASGVVARPWSPGWQLIGAMALLVLVNMTGAITALGDTLFPTQPALGPELFAKIREDASAGQHFLVRLRAIHPILAALSGLLVFSALGMIQRTGKSRWALAGMALVLIQMTLGATNVALGAPGWMQIAHLLLAQILWAVVVVVGMER